MEEQEHECRKERETCVRHEKEDTGDGQSVSPEANMQTLVKGRKSHVVRPCFGSVPVDLFHTDTFTPEEVVAMDSETGAETG